MRKPETGIPHKRTSQRPSQRTSQPGEKRAGEKRAGEQVGNESDIVSFWLLLLFVAVFFGIAAEEAKRPMFASSSDIASQAPKVLLDIRNESRPEKLEVPATGK